MNPTDSDRIVISDLATEIISTLRNSRTTEWDNKSGAGTVRRSLHEAWELIDIVERIRDMSAQGEITPRNPLTGLPPGPISPMEKDWFLSLPDADKVREKLYGLTKAAAPEIVGAGKTAKGSKQSDKPLENWMMQVQAEATKRWREQRALGCNPNPHSLKDELATWCRDNKIFTKGNINPNPEYLYRHVLSSRHWTPPTD